MNKHPVGVSLRKVKNLLDVAEKNGCMLSWNQATDILDDMVSRKVFASEDGRPFKDKAARLRVRAETMLRRLI